MSIHPQDALQRMIAAFEAHYHAALSTQSPTSPHLVESEQRLRDAFFTYDDALFNTYGVDLPFDLVGDEDDEDDDYFDDEDEYVLDDGDDFDQDDFDEDDLDEDDLDDDDDDDLEIIYFDEDDAGDDEPPLALR